MTRQLRPLQLSFCLALWLGCCVLPARADDLPVRKAGLWEMKILKTGALQHLLRLLIAGGILFVTVAQRMEVLRVLRRGFDHRLQTPRGTRQHLGGWRRDPSL